MLIFCDSFDHYATADITKKWDYNYYGSSILPTGGRRGGGAMTGGNVIARKTFPGNYSTLIVGFAVKPLDLESALIFFKDGSAIQCAFRLNGAGRIEVYRGDVTLLGTSTANFAQGVFNYIEFKLTVHDTAGSFEVRKNGINILSMSTVNTRGSGSSNNYSNNIQLSQIASTFTLDDLYVCDTSGSTNNDFLGDVRIDASYPTGDGTFQSWNPSSGSAHFSLVDSTTPGLTDYVYTSTVGNKDTYTFPALGGAVSAIYGVQVNAAALKDLSGTRTMALTCKSGSTNSDGSSQALSTSQSYYSSIYETDPNIAAAWTVANLGAAEFGVKCVS